ncbi:hypothetical protein B0H10DRAFT_105567 [Mycena sp. CBHHK59/15]|nr:hypothetical protein B0H10DRAFT_105567 [Mycena sp. CBHHK59/15]
MVSAYLASPGAAPKTPAAVGKRCMVADFLSGAEWDVFALSLALNDVHDGAFAEWALPVAFYSAGGHRCCRAARRLDNCEVRRIHRQVRCFGSPKDRKQHEYHLHAPTRRRTGRLPSLGREPRHPRATASSEEFCSPISTTQRRSTAAPVVHPGDSAADSMSLPKTLSYYERAPISCARVNPPAHSPSRSPSRLTRASASLAFRQVPGPVAAQALSSIRPPPTPIPARYFECLGLPVIPLPCGRRLRCTRSLAARTNRRGACCSVAACGETVIAGVAHRAASRGDAVGEAAQRRAAVDGLDGGDWGGQVYVV